MSKHNKVVRNIVNNIQEYYCNKCNKAVTPKVVLVKDNGQKTAVCQCGNICISQ